MWDIVQLSFVQKDVKHRDDKFSVNTRDVLIGRVENVDWGKVCLREERRVRILSENSTLMIVSRFVFSPHLNFLQLLVVLGEQRCLVNGVLGAKTHIVPIISWVQLINILCEKFKDSNVQISWGFVDALRTASKVMINVGLRWRRKKKKSLLVL